MQVEVSLRIKQRGSRMALKGFTLMELLVAVVLAGFLTAAAFAFLGRTQSLHYLLVSSYRQDTATLLEEIRQVHPYQQKKRRSNLRHF